MANDKLTWDKTHKRWKKMVNGTLHLLSAREVNKTDQKVYKAAQAKLARIRAGIDLPTEQEGEAALMRIKDFRALFSLKDHDYSESGVQRLLQSGRAQEWAQKETDFWLASPDDSGSIKTVAKLYVDLKRATLRVSSLNNIIARLKWLQHNLGESYNLKKLNEPAVTRLKAAVVIKGDVARGGSAFDCWRTVVTFFNWSYEEGYIQERPRNVTMKNMPKAVAQEADPMPVEQFRALYAVASPRMRLMMLFAANCGYTQADIADLKPEEYDGQFLDNKRRKTELHASTPRIVRKLWPETIQLLDQFKGDGEYLVPNEDGGPIVKHGEEESKSDAINSAWWRLKQAAELPDAHPYGSIKKTSSSAIMNVGRFREHIELLLLGRGIPGVNKRYLFREFPQFHAATDWLRTYYFPKS